jgi:hypothetical protein
MINDSSTIAPLLSFPVVYSIFSTCATGVSGYSLSNLSKTLLSLRNLSRLPRTFMSIIAFFGSMYVMITSNLNSVSQLALPNVDPILLALMGLSQAAYIGGKKLIPEHQGLHRYILG